MKFLSVCSGIEAASVAWEPMGWKAVAFAEIEPFPAAVLAHHYPAVPNFGDMTQLPDLLRAGVVDLPDMLCGGTPCQAFSVAGLRKSLSDARGNLSLTFCEIANAIDDERAAAGLEPGIIFWENVPGVLSTADNAFGCFLAALAGESEPLIAPGGKWTNAGAVFGPQRAVAWRILDAQYFGVAQRRRRVFVVASARDDFDPAAVLFEFDGVRRDTAPSREAGQATAGGAARSVALRGREGGATAELGDDLAGCLRASGGGGDKPHTLAPVITMAHGQGGAEIGFDRGPCLTCNHEAPIAAYPATTHTLRGDGFDASEDGTGRGTPLVPVAFAQNSRDELRLEGGDGSRTGALTSGGGKPGQGVPMIAFSAKDYGGDAMADLSPTLRAGGHSTSHANAGVMPAIAFHPTQDPINSENVCHSIGANDNATAAVAIFQGENDGRMDGGTPQSQNDLPAGAVRDLRCCECGSASQERGLEGSPTGEPATLVQKLPHESAQVGREVPSVREAAQGSGVLRHALPALQEARRPGIQADAPCLHCGGLRVSKSFNGLVREACATVQTGHTWQTADDKKRGRANPMAVRRLTPVECERLQGFPDNWTLIPWRNKPADQCPDGPRYKALGNSWAVPNVRWIGQRIDLHLMGLL